MNSMLSKDIIEKRLQSLFAYLNEAGQTYDTVLIIDRINQYYYTGTIQNGLLVLRKDGSVFFFVRKSFDRANIESSFRPIIQMHTYRDMLAYLPDQLGSVYIETESMPIGMLDRIRKYFSIDTVLPLDQIIARQRAVKSEYELEYIRESGRRHNILMEQTVPSLLREGISETDFAAELYAAMIKGGHHGVSRFSMFQMEIIIGQIGFGDTSIYPTNFNGPGGMLGMYPVVPILGNRDRCLQKGHLVFVDVGYGYMGYHSDKTQVYSFGCEPDEYVKETHKACMQVLEKTISLLRPGNIPADIYRESMQGKSPLLNNHFMGYGDEKVKFLGHGVGLYVDEMPVITGGYTFPLEKNMVIAIEPKCGIKDVGMVGVEETFVVESEGAVCITGGAREIMTVPA